MSKGKTQKVVQTLNTEYRLISTGDRFRIQRRIYYPMLVEEAHWELLEMYYPWSEQTLPWETRFRWRAVWKLKVLREHEARRVAERNAIWEAVKDA